MAVKLVTLRTPLEPIEFPNGTEHAVREIDGPMEELRQEATAEASGEKFHKLYRLICPTASDADWASMTTEDYANLWKHAASKLLATLELVEQNRKNGLAGSGPAAPARRSRRSSRTTKSRTSAPASPEPTAPGSQTP